MSTLDLSTLPGGDIAVALRSGKADVNSVVAHLANRALPMDGLLAVLPALPMDLQSAVMLAQMALQQQRPAKPKQAAIRPGISESGKRLVIVQPPKDVCPGGYTLTNPPATWLWLLDNAATIRAACDSAAQYTDADVSQAVTAKLVKRSQSAFERHIAVRDPAQIDNASVR